MPTTVWKWYKKRYTCSAVSTFEQAQHAERLIGSIRRECLDHVVIFGEGHLRQVLKAYAAYYNRVRTHLALGKDAPLVRSVQQFGFIAARPILGGLHHEYCRT